MSFALKDYLNTQDATPLMRFITCGSVDDGKSTLIGRLLYDAKLIFDDQLAGLERDSKKHGTTGEEIDFALLVDGLSAEREQGITIDVAYRFFNTDKRKFIVADTPGHEQYTRNMATGASTADAAVILIDARKGILTQTRRHSFIVSLLGIRHVVLAVNKIDLVDYDQAVFDQIVADYNELAKKFSFKSLTAIPLSARYGENVFSRSDKMAWYNDKCLIETLESLPLDENLTKGPLRFPVQWVNRPHLDFRGFTGTLSSGVVRVGQAILNPRSGQQTTVKSVITTRGEQDHAIAHEAITLVLSDEVDVSRGDVLCDPQNRPIHTDQFQAHLIWMSDVDLLPSRTYLLKIGAQTVPASITEIKHRIDVNSFEKLAAKKIGLNEVCVVNIATTGPLTFDPYQENADMGGFILIDRLTNLTLGAGMIDFSLMRSDNVHKQAFEVTPEKRAEQKGQRPAVLWFTGLSGSGKSTIANEVEKMLISEGRHSYVLDGDNVRTGLNKDLGFTDVDRVENIRRVAEVSKLMVDAGLLTLVSFISPFRSERRMARELFEGGQFIEIHVATSLELAEKRDVKGLYKRAREGKIKNFTGIDSPYEAPEKSEITLDTHSQSASDCAKIVVTYLRDHGFI